MPLYEYRCSDCQTSFEKLRPMRDADKPSDCPKCHGQANKRLISAFAAVSRGSDGSSRMVASSHASGGCGSCGGGSCASCHH
jgi:putative FmdB family regulatory protein